MQAVIPYFSCLFTLLFCHDAFLNSPPSTASSFILWLGSTVVRTPLELELQQLGLLSSGPELLQGIRSPYLSLSCSKEVPGAEGGGGLTHTLPCPFDPHPLWSSQRPCKAGN